MLRVWNLSLLCATFSLTILGTFLTRSGVLESVHAFSDSDIGAWLLSFFGLIVAVTLGLIGWRGDRLRSPGRIDSPVLAGGRLPRQQRALRRLRVRRAAGHGVPAHRRGPQRPGRDRRPAVLQPHDGADRHRPAVPDGGRPGAPVAEGVHASCWRSGCSGRRGRRDRARRHGRASAPAAWARSSPSGSAPSPAGRGPPPGRAGHPPPGLARLRRPHQRRHDRPPRRGHRRRGHRRPTATTSRRSRPATSRGRPARSAATRSPTCGTDVVEEAQPHRHQGAACRSTAARCTSPRCRSTRGSGRSSARRR